PEYEMPTVTWGVIQGKKEKLVNRVKICDHLRTLGVITDELETIELPSTIEVISERLEFLQKLGIYIINRWMGKMLGRRSNTVGSRKSHTSHSPSSRFILSPSWPYSCPWMRRRQRRVKCILPASDQQHGASPCCWMHRSGWEKCWEDGVTPWDQGRATPLILHLLDSSSLPLGRTLVPGCGGGHDVVAMANPERFVVGLDISEKTLKKASEVINAGSLMF
ncbi:hypothetical protein F2Q69_00010613, partial [Brassica cretica]